jgi:hypothetical protein
VLVDGAARAREQASATIKSVKDIVGFVHN